MRATGKTYRTILRALVEASIRKQDVIVVVDGRNAQKAIHSNLWRLAPQGSSDQYRHCVILPNGSMIRVIQSHANLSCINGIRYYDHAVMEKAKQ